VTFDSSYLSVFLLVALGVLGLLVRLVLVLRQLIKNSMMVGFSPSVLFTLCFCCLVISGAWSNILHVVVLVSCITCKLGCGLSVSLILCCLRGWIVIEWGKEGRDKQQQDGGLQLPEVRGGGKNGWIDCLGGSLSRG
jgi:hypothetical protein